jgi:hypothetical protein
MVPPTSQNIGCADPEPLSRSTIIFVLRKISAPVQDPRPFGLMRANALAIVRVSTDTGKNAGRELPLGSDGHYAAKESSD